MGVSLKLVNHDEHFLRYSGPHTIIVNDFEESSEKQKEFLNKLIYTTYAGDVLSNLPQCDCGEVVGEHNARDEYRAGTICPNCGTECVSRVDQPLVPLVYLRVPRRPDGTPLGAMINPIVWLMLRKKFTTGSFEVIRWMCDSSYSPAVKEPPVLAVIQRLMRESGIKRGLDSFVENFDSLMDILFSLKAYRIKGKKINNLYKLIKEQRHCIFSEHLPVPNRALLVIEEGHLGTYVDPIITGAIDAVRSLVGIDTDLSVHSVKVKENRAIKAISQLADYYEGVFKNTLAKKPGIFRKHVFGSRAHFSFRGVISSLTDKHDYDEVHSSWGIGVSVMRLHLMNKLIRRGFTPNTALAFLNEHSQKYHSLLDELFQLLIAECPYKGIPIILQRNPSLERASAQALFITKFKTAVEDPTISISILAVKGWNADFDGDQLNGTLCLDLMTAEELRKLAPHMSAMDMNAPRTVAVNLSMPKPVIATISNWMHYPEEDEPDPVKDARMAALPSA